MNTVATDELDELSAALENPSHERLEAAYQRVIDASTAHLALQSPSSTAFMARMVELLRSVPGTEFATQRLTALFNAYFYSYYTAAPVGAIASDAVDLARRSGHPLLRKALTFQGVHNSDTGNVPRAIECLAEALDVARAQGDVNGEASVWVNMAAPLVYSALYRDALAGLEHAIWLVETRGAASHFAGTAWSNIALCCLHTGETERGLRAAENALRATPPLKTKGDMVSFVLRKEYYSRLLLEAGDVEAAGKQAAEAVEAASQIDSLRAQIAAAMAQGLCDIYAGRTEAGLELLTRMAARSRSDLPVMMRDVLSILVKAYEFLGMPREALACHQELLEWLRRWHHDNALEHVRLHMEPLGATAERDSAFSSRLRKQEAHLRGKLAEQETFRSPLEMLERLAVTAELREDSTGEHCYRLGKLSALLAREAGSDAETCERIEHAARLHDIGKNAIPDAIILKRGKLTDAEREIVRTHSAIGADLLAGSNIPHMDMAEQIARHHHEWWDGSEGRRSGSDIPHAARMVAIADVFDALTHERPHRGAWSTQEALNEVVRLKGVQFDPQLVDLFVAMIARLRREHQDLDTFLGEAATSSSFLQARSRIKDVLQRGE